MLKKKAKKVAAPKKASRKPAPAKSGAGKGGGDQAGGMSLVIVESPAKERTISRFLKSGFVVRSSYGHVRDLPLRKIGVDVDHDFKPQYVVLPRVKKLLSEFKSLVERSPYVYLATDHDREGESIAWHLVELLGLPGGRVRRITFHEITPGAIHEAIASPRSIDNNLVDAQQARRIIDRLVGYKLSPLLWAKIQSGLSAGRVQSVAVRLLAERQREIGEFSSEGFWTLTAVLEKPGAPPAFSAKLSLWQGEKIEATRTFDLFAEQYRVKATSLRGPEDARAIDEALRSGSFKVVKVERKEVRRRPSPPFSTSTLQQAASQRLGFAAERTMRVAQSLYEGVDLGSGETVGLITYLRTDSFSISKVAAQEARSFLHKKFGQGYLPAEAPVYQTKARGAQEAHEAIRPTSVWHVPEELRTRLNPDQAKLYQLIWRRFLASQMVEAVYDTVAADIENGPALFHCSGRSLKFDGFLKAFESPSAAEQVEEPVEEEEDGARLP
ncbi:MAG: type I DNA topoisomerase, partial [Elusimicrobia bacterium]|nr:type I DNA topoisomerase [Elusimicrobiota bacterium]